MDHNNRAAQQFAMYHNLTEYQTVIMYHYEEENLLPLNVSIINKKPLHRNAS